MQGGRVVGRRGDINGANVNVGRWGGREINTDGGGREEKGGGGILVEMM